MPLTHEQLPILISGLAGVHGYNTFYYFKKHYPGQVCGIRPVQTRSLMDDDIHIINGEDLQSLQALFRAHRFRTVIDASGCCALKSCEYNHELARTVNIDCGRNLMQLARDFGSRLVRFSSDLVFDGCGDGGYVESAPVSPVTIYGQTMAEAEQII
ncbi:MAG: sugar nucleotide-binding protein, partial [Deltaproteobacteria bacterium]|nr:sugar nucleotide-binding protein [Deltaproteobacteria bacterium]